MGLAMCFFFLTLAEIPCFVFPLLGSGGTNLHAVLPVSISQAEQVRLDCFLREKLTCDHQQVATSRCGGMAGLVSDCSERTSTST
jgi:hypothetical protein